MVDKTLELINRGEDVSDDDVRDMLHKMMEDAQEFAQIDAFERPFESFPELTAAELKELGL